VNKVDNTDIKLIISLQEDRGKSISELSLSRPSVSERLTSLLDKGIIKKIGARVNLSALGRDV
jgi:Lrp/AsnC family leucine-responsive transcriptional regulator